MIEEIVIREAGPEDCRALSIVGSATFLETFAGTLDGSAVIEHCRNSHSEEYYRDALATGCRAFLAETASGRAPVGFALVGPPQLPVAESGDLELKRIYLLGKFQGCGAGARLLDEAIGAAASSRRLLLGVFAGNSRAQAFYERHGFAPVGKRAFSVGGVPYDDTIYARVIRH